MKTRQKSGSLRCPKYKCTNCPGCSVHGKLPSGRNRRAEKRRFNRAPSTDSSCVTERVNSVTDKSVHREEERHITDPDSDIEFGPAHTIVTDEEIMKINTKNYCIFCYKECSQSLRQRSSGDEDVNNQEICSRFMKLLTRYLKLDIYRHVISTDQQKIFRRQNFVCKTLKKGKIDLEIQACDACLINVRAFCDLYHQWQYIHLQLDWNIAKFRNVMKCAEKVTSRVQEFREKVFQGKDGMRKEEMVVMDGFKREFFRKSIPKRFPKVKVQRLEEERRSGVNGISKCTKTVLVHKQLSNENETRRSSRRAHAIDVLKIGQELRLTSRRQSDKNGNDNVQTLITDDNSKAAKTVSLIPVVQKLVREMSVPSDSDMVKRTSKKPIRVAPSSTSTSQSQKSKRSCIGRQSGPASRVRRELDECKSKRQVVYTNCAKRLKLSKSYNGPCEVIDLCDSSDDEEVNKGNEVLKTHTPPAKKVKMAKVPEIEDRADNRISSGTENQSQSEVDHGSSQNFKSRVPCLEPVVTNNKIPFPESVQPGSPDLQNVSSEPNTTEMAETSTEISGEILQPQVESLEDTRNRLPDGESLNSVQCAGAHDDDVHQENLAYSQPIIECSNEYLQDGSFLQTHIELPTPPEQPGQGIEVTLEPGNQDQEVHSVSVTITQTFTSTFSGGASEGFNIPIPPIFPAFNEATFPPSPQELYSQLYSQSDNSFVQQFDGGNMSTEPHSESSPVVVEAEEDINVLGTDRSKSSVHISEVVEETYNDGDDVQIIESVDPETDKVVVLMRPT